MILFEIERHYNHFAHDLVDRLREFHIIRIEQVLALFLKDIEQTEGEFHLRYKFEEGKIIVASHAEFHHEIELFQQKLLLFLDSKVEHGADAGRYVRAVVVETFGREFQMQRQGYICCLHLLARYLPAVLFAEYNVVLPEVHCGQSAQGEMVSKTEVGKHAHAEAGVILRNVGTPRLAVLRYKAVVHELHILNMHTCKET